MLTKDAIFKDEEARKGNEVKLQMLRMFLSIRVGTLITAKKFQANAADMDSYRRRFPAKCSQRC